MRHLTSLTEFGDEVGTADASQRLFDAASLFGFVPEEILALGKFVTRGLG